MRKVIVTGGAGFISAHLAERLAVYNKVSIIDNLPMWMLKNIDTFSSEANVIFTRDNILELPLLNRLFQTVDLL